MKIRFYFFIAALLFVLAGLGGARDFVPLFNGENLDGWVNVNCAPETWSVVDGMIHCSGIPTGVLRTERMYENYILDLESRHLLPKGNSGLFVFSGPLPVVGKPFTRAIEIQILDGRETKNYRSPSSPIDNVARWSFTSVMNLPDLCLRSIGMIFQSVRSDHPPPLILLFHPDGADFVFGYLGYRVERGIGEHVRRAFGEVERHRDRAGRRVGGHFRHGGHLSPA